MNLNSTIRNLQAPTDPQPTFIHNVKANRTIYFWDHFPLLCESLGEWQHYETDPDIVRQISKARYLSVTSPQLSDVIGCEVPEVLRTLNNWNPLNGR